MHKNQTVCNSAMELEKLELFLYEILHKKPYLAKTMIHLQGHESKFRTQKSYVAGFMIPGKDNCFSRQVTSNSSGIPYIDHGKESFLLHNSRDQSGPRCRGLPLMKSLYFVINSVNFCHNSLKD